MIPCKHPADLIDEYAFTDLDILTIDTEGHDYAILKAFPFDRVRPSIVEFEGKTMTPIMINDMQQLFESYGYKLFDSNATPDRLHWMSKWQYIELFAVRIA